jgi:hypothetical protein
MPHREYTFTREVQDLGLDAAMELDRISRGKEDVDGSVTKKLLSMFREISDNGRSRVDLPIGGWQIAYSAYTTAIDPNVLEKTRTVAGFYDLYDAWLSRSEEIVAALDPADCKMLLDQVLRLQAWALHTATPIRLDLSQYSATAAHA